MKENIFERINLDTKRIAKDFIETMTSAEISLFLGREKYQDRIWCQSRHEIIEMDATTDLFV